jgi:hypothetical protein
MNTDMFSANFINLTCFGGNGCKVIETVNDIIAKNLTEAIAKVNEIATSGDVVLYENDLPDTYDE